MSHNDRKLEEEENGLYPSRNTKAIFFQNSVSVLAMCYQKTLSADL